MAQVLRTIATLLENYSSIPSIQVTHDFLPLWLQGYEALFQPPRAHTWHTLKETCAYTELKPKVKLFPKRYL